MRWLRLITLWAIFSSFAAVPPGRRTLSGNVIDSSGRPVAEARVWAFADARDSAENKCLRLLGEMETGADGGFFFVRPTETNEECSVVASKKGLALGWETWRPGADFDATITLRKPHVLAGRVVDEKGRGIRGATVHAAALVRNAYFFGLPPFEGLTRKTDWRGRFEFRNLPKDACAEFIVSAPGRATLFTGWSSRSLYLPQYEAGRKDIRIVLPREATVEGKVLERVSRNPVAGVVILAQRRWGRPTIGNATAVSGADGTFRIGGLSAGEYVLSSPAWTGEGGPGVLIPRECTAQAGRASRGELLEMTDGGVVEVRVLDAADSRPMANALARFVSWDTGISLCRTAKDGFFRARLPAGDWSTEAARAGFESVRRAGYRDVTVEEGRTHEVTHLLRRRKHIRGIVHDPAGKPLPGVEVQVWPGGIAPTRTDEAGAFEVEEHERILLARHPRRNLVATLAISEDMQVAEMTLHPAGRVAVQVTDPSGKPVEGVHVYVAMDAFRYISPLADCPVRPGTEDIYEAAALPAGQSYTLNAFARDYTSGEHKFSISRPDETVDLGRIVLRPEDLSVSGWVLDEKGKAVPQAMVFAADEWTRFPREVTADTAGGFTIPRLAAGKVWLSTSAAGARWDFWGVETFAGASDVRVILRGEVGKWPPVQSPPEAPASLVGKPLPSLEDFKVDFDPSQAQGRMVLLCFWNPQREDERRWVLDLLARYSDLSGRGVSIVALATGWLPGRALTDWAARWDIPFPIGQLSGDPGILEWKWRARDRPRLILTDRRHVVRAEGFAPHELNALVEKISSE